MNIVVRRIEDAVIFNGHVVPSLETVKVIDLNNWMDEAAEPIEENVNIPSFGFPEF